MAQFVKSIEKFTLTLGAGTAWTTGVLSKNQAIANCVPFVTYYVTTYDSPNIEDRAQYLVDADFSDSTHVRVATGQETSRALSVEVQVVEFDATYINVQQATFDLVAGDGYETQNETLTTFVEAKTFPYLTYQSDTGGSSDGSKFNVRARIDATDTVGFETGLNASRAISGHCYLVEAKNIEFAVTESNVGISSGSSVTDSFALVDVDKSAVFGSYKTSTGDYRNEWITVDCSLDSDGLGITAQRTGTTGRIDGAWYTVEFSGNEDVYHETFTGDASTPYTRSIGATLGYTENSIVLCEGKSSNTSGSFPGAGATDVPDAYCRFQLPSTTQVSIAHDIDGGEASNDITWGVIEFDMPAPQAPETRRVMVIS